MASITKKKGKQLIWIIAIVAVILIGVGTFIFFRTRTSKSVMGQNISYTMLKTTTLESSISASGSVVSNNTVTVSSTVSAKVTEVNVKVGDKVEKGQVLAKLDTTDLQTAVNTAQTNYNSAKTQYDLKVSQASKSVTNAQTNVASCTTALETAKKAYAGAMGDAEGSANYQARYNDAENKDQATKSAVQALNSASNNLSQAQDNYATTVANDSTSNAKTQLQTAKDNLAAATITAPISGIIASSSAVVGSTASGGSAGGSGTAGSGSTGSGLFTIQGENSFQIKASVADYDVIKLSVDKEVQITVDSTSTAMTGTILTVSPIANSSGYYEFTASISGDTSNLRVGMSATIKVILEKKENIFAVAVDSVMKVGDKKYVVAVDSSNNESRIEVTTGMETDYFIEISGTGLKDGLRILNDPMNKLTNNTSTQNKNNTNANFGSMFGGGEMNQQGGTRPNGQGGTAPSGTPRG